MYMFLGKQFYFVTGLCHKEIMWDMRAHLRIQLLANLQSIRTYVKLRQPFFNLFLSFFLKEHLLRG